MLDFMFKHENYVDLIFCQLKNLNIHNSVFILSQADQHNITELSCMISPLACSSMHRSQITFLFLFLLSHHHSTSALVSEILMSVLQTVQKNNRQFTYGQTVQKKTTDNLHMDRQCKKKQQTICLWTDSAKKTTDNLPMDRQCKKK